MSAGYDSCSPPLAREMYPEMGMYRDLGPSPVLRLTTCDGPRR